MPILKQGSPEIIKQVVVAGEDFERQWNNAKTGSLPPETKSKDADKKGDGNGDREKR